MLKHKWRYYLLAVAIWFIYFIATYNPARTAASVQKYHLSAPAVVALIISLLLPIFICWMFAFSGWFYLRVYAKSISSSVPDYQGYRLLGISLSVLALSLLAPAVVTALYDRLMGGQITALRTWVNTYTALIFPLAAFFLASLGSRHLLASLKLKPEPWIKSLAAIIPMLVFAIFYLGLIFTNPARQISTIPGLQPTYYLPDFMIVLTIVIPVIATWAFGFRTALNLEHYSHYVSPDQKPALVNIYNGLLAIIGSVILEQVISSLGTSRLTNLNLSLILAIIYVLLAIIVVGYALIARGAKQLAALKRS